MNQGVSHFKAGPLCCRLFARLHLSKPKHCLRAYWEQGKDIGDTAVLRAVAEEVGLNTKDFEQILASEGFNEQVNADIEMAHEFGLTGVPALIFADRYLVIGAQPYQVLKQVVERVIEEEKGGEGERA